MAKSIRSKVKKRFRTVKREKLRAAVADNLKDLHEKALAAPRQEIGTSGPKSARSKLARGCRAPSARLGARLPLQDHPLCPACRSRH